MENQLVPEKEIRKSSGVSALLIWPALFFLVYVLAIGPLMLMTDRKVISPGVGTKLEYCYAPLEWAYKNTSLHRPLGMYLHLWSKRFDKNGDTT